MIGADPDMMRHVINRKGILWCLQNQLFQPPDIFCRLSTTPIKCHADCHAKTYHGIRDISDCLDRVGRVGRNAEMLSCLIQSPFSVAYNT